MAWLKLLVTVLALLGQSPDAQPTDLAVVSKGGSTWFALGAGRELTVYRLERRHLRVDGTARLPTDLTIRWSDWLSTTSVVPGAAPNFTFHSVGADTWWFAIAARIRGRWQFVPFDDSAGPRHRWTLAYGASHRLIHGVVDSCGCAGGPTTEQWFRFSRGVFVATAPPGVRADCSAAMLAAARHWPRLPYDSLVRSIDRPLAIARFACAAGWALATDGRTISIYEQRGRAWLRVGIGSPKLVRSHIEFAMPQSLLFHLGRRIGAAFAS